MIRLRVLPKPILQLTLLVCLAVAAVFCSLPRTVGVVSAKKEPYQAKPAAMPLYYRDRVAVLMFHNISPSLTGRGTITPKQFDEDLTALQESGYHIVPVSHLIGFLDQKKSIPDNAVTITFDDGYEGVYDYALPLLRKHKATATVFVIDGLVGKDRGILTWPEVRALDTSGVVSIGGHTYDQHYLVYGRPVMKGAVTLRREPATVNMIYNFNTRKLESQSDYERRMLADTIKSQQTFLAELGHTTPYFAYPYGAYTPDYVDILRAAGYRYIFTVINGINDSHQNPRYIFRINCGAPWITPQRMLAKIKLTEAMSRLQQAPPAGWLPAEGEMAPPVHHAGKNQLRRHPSKVKGTIPARTAERGIRDGSGWRQWGSLFGEEEII